MPYVPPSPTISGFVDLESVTYGRLGHEYVAQNCSTFYTNQTYSFLRCTTVPGIGMNHQWLVKVRGQTNQPAIRKVDGTIENYGTSYKRPRITQFFPGNGGPTTGGTTVVLMGENLGTNLPGITYKIRLLRETDKSDASTTKSPQSIYQYVDGTKSSIPRCNGKECIAFKLPEGYGKRFVDIKMTYLDDSVQNILQADGNNEFNYDPPSIGNVQMIDVGSGKAKLKIFGENFLSSQKAPSTFVANSATGTGDVNSTMCCDNTTWTNATLIVECEKRNTKLGTFDRWDNEQIHAHANSTMPSFLYVVVGKIQSNIAFYSLNSTTIHAAPYDTLENSIKEKFDNAPLGIWYAGKNEDPNMVTSMYLGKGLG